MRKGERASLDELRAEERTTSLRRLKAAEDIATARAKDAADRYDKCVANPESTVDEKLAALEGSVKFHTKAAAACKRLIEALRDDKPGLPD